MVIKTHVKNKSDINLSVFDLKENQHSKILAGALRHEFNAKYFKGYKKVLNSETGKKELSCPKNLLDSKERKNVKNTVENLIQENRYYNYKKASKKHNNNVAILNKEFREIKILNGIVYYKMIIQDSKKLLNSRTIQYKLELEKPLPDGIYKKAGISLVNGKLKLVIDLSSKKSSEKVTKRNISVKISKKVQKHLTRLKDFNNIYKIKGSKKTSEFEKRMAKRKLEKMQRDFFEVFWKIWKETSDAQFECIKEFNKKTGKKYENQVILPHNFFIDDDIFMKVIDDFEYYYKTEAKNIVSILNYYNSILFS